MLRTKYSISPGMEIGAKTKRPLRKGDDGSKAFAFLLPIQSRNFDTVIEGAASYLLYTKSVSNSQKESMGENEVLELRKKASQSPSPNCFLS